MSVNGPSSGDLYKTQNNVHRSAKWYCVAPFLICGNMQVLEQVFEISTHICTRDAA